MTRKTCQSQQPHNQHRDKVCSGSTRSMLQYSFGILAIRVRSGDMVRDIDVQR